MSINSMKGCSTNEKIQQRRGRWLEHKRKEKIVDTGREGKREGGRNGIQEEPRRPAGQKQEGR